MDNTEVNTSSLILTFGHMTWKSIGNIYFLWAPTALSLAIFMKRGGGILNKYRQFYLYLWPCDLKINGVIYLLGASTVLCQSLATFKQRGQKADNNCRLAVWHGPWKSIGNIYSIGTSTVLQLSSKGVKKYWAVYRLTNRLTDRPTNR